MVTYRQPFVGEFVITQHFGEKVTDPKGHSGIDYACPAGTEILASADGIVMAAGWDRTGYGFRIILKHDDGRATLYAHLESINVLTLEKVCQGEVIGKSGWSGNVVPAGPAGAHLHFEARKTWNIYDSAFDPMDLPLTSVYDQPAADGKPAAKETIRAGWVRVVCDLANVRNTYNFAIINGQKRKGEVFEITEGVKMINGLPYHRIRPRTVDELGGLIAEYDLYGTQILEGIDGDEKENC